MPHQLWNCNSPVQIDWQVTYHSQGCCWAPREMCNLPHTCHSQRSYNSHCPNDRSTSSDDQCYRLSCRLIWVEVCCKWNGREREKWSHKHKHLYLSAGWLSCKQAGWQSCKQWSRTFLPWEKGCMEHWKTRWCVYFPALLLHWLIDDQCIFCLTLQECIRTDG